MTRRLGLESLLEVNYPYFGRWNKLTLDTVGTMIGFVILWLVFVWSYLKVS